MTTNPPNPSAFEVQDNVMTPEGSKVVVTWMILQENPYAEHHFMVVGENIVEALRAATLLEEERQANWQGF